jgi:DNA-binding NarL/FixJ family response regulator
MSSRGLVRENAFLDHPSGEAPIAMPEPAAHKLRVFLIDDHPIVREGFALALASEPDMTVVGQAGTASDALRETATLKPDVVLVDLNIPDRDGIELLGVLRVQLPHARLLVLSGYDDEYRVAEALRAGAQGYLVKTARLEEVVDGIRRIATGGAPLSPRIAGAVVRAMRKPAGEGSGGLDTLTPRERQVLRLLAAGVSTRETASQLTISPKTVETHRVRIYAKLGCKSAIELTRIAVRTGLIEA